MADHAKLFRNGGSQAVRLPKGCRLEGWSSIRLPGLERCVSGLVGDFPYPADPPPVEPGPDFDG